MPTNNDALPPSMIMVIMGRCQQFREYADDIVQRWRASAARLRASVPYKGTTNDHRVNGKKMSALVSNRRRGRAERQACAHRGPKVFPTSSARRIAAHRALNMLHADDVVDQKLFERASITLPATTVTSRIHACQTCMASVENRGDHVTVTPMYMICAA